MLEEECLASGREDFFESASEGISRTTEFVVRAEGEEFRGPALVAARRRAK